MSFSVVILLTILLFCVFQFTYFIFCAKGVSVRTRDMFLASGYIALTVCVSVLYYHVFCVRYVDADRMYQEMENALYKGNGYLFELYGINPFSALLILLPALVGLPYLIKSIAAFVYFGCMFLLAWKLRKKFSPVSIFLAVLFLLCTLDLSYPADGIRFPMACMIFCSALVLNKYNNLSRINTTVLVLIACLLHVSFWPFFVLFIITPLLGKEKFALVAFCCLFYFPFVVSFSSVIAKFNPSLGWKMQLYFEVGGQYYQDLISKEQIAFLLFIYLFCILLIIYGLKKGIVEYDLYIKYCIIFSSITLGSIPSNVMFPRYAPIIILMAFPLVSTIFSYYTSTGKRKGILVKDKSIHFVFFAFLVVVFGSIILRCTFSYAVFYVA